MENNVQLKEAFNRVEVVGILAEKKLEIKNFNGKDAITGELVIKTGESSFIKMKVFTNRLKTDGTENKVFIGLNTVMNEYKSIAETGNEEEADKVQAVGKLSEGKPFLNQNTGEVVVALANQLSFISRVTNLATYEPKAKWQGEVFVQNYKVEMKKNGEELEETGRKLMNVVVPVYGGKVFPMTLILEEEGAEWFEDNVEKGSTIKVYCDLVNKTEKIVQGSTSGGFGKKEPQVFTRVINERVVTGADDAYPTYEEGEESQKAYNPQVITQALAVREQIIEETKNETPSTSTSSTHKTSFGGSTKTSSSPQQEEEYDSDIPF